MSDRLANYVEIGFFLPLFCHDLWIPLAFFKLFRSPAGTSQPDGPSSDSSVTESACFRMALSELGRSLVDAKPSY
jgi:hypothetical protein